jgi:hypothetical protein
MVWREALTAGAAGTGLQIKMLREPKCLGSKVPLVCVLSTGHTFILAK